MIDHSSSLVCIQQTYKMRNLKVLSLLLLGSCGVVFVCSQPVTSEDETVGNDAAVTLSTELLPPPLPAEAEHRGIVYLINLFAVKNKTDKTPEGKAGNVLTDDSSEITGPLASILLVVEDDDDVDGDEITVDNLAKEFLEDNYNIEGIGTEEKTSDIKPDSTISEEISIAEDKPKKLKKIRRKRTLKKYCQQCGGGENYGNGGGYGGGYPSGGSIAIIPVVVIPSNTGGGGGGRGHRGHHHGGNRGYDQHNQGYGGQNNYYPNGGGGGQHPSGYPVGDGWGGGGSNSYSQSSAQSSAQSSSYNG